MNCEDLTISDYIKHNGTIKIVDAVYLYSVSVHDPSEEWSISEAKTYPVDDIEPIKLTEEILVKNGFKKESQTIDGDYCKFTLPGFALNWCDTDGFWYQNGDITPNHVHTLQHLLRLVGIEKVIEL